MEIFSPSRPPAVGSPITGGTENSILFVGAGGVVSQDNANFSRTAAQFKYKTITEHATNGAFLLQFSGWNGVGYTQGLVIETTDAVAYSPIQIIMKNAAYTTRSTMRTGDNNGIYFVGTHNARWSFTCSEGGGLQGFNIYCSNAAVSEAVAELTTGYATQRGFKIKLAASQSADAFQVFASDDTTKLFNIGATGFIETIEQTAPAAPAANGVRIYAVDNGAGKTQLMALFSSGAAQQLAIQP